MHKKHIMRKKSSKTIDRENLSLWRNKILLRDNNECQICKSELKNKENSKFHAHHIIPKEIKLTRYDVNNGITLCFYHHKVGRKSAHNNAIWFSEWFKKYKPLQFKYILEKLKEIENS